MKPSERIKSIAGTIEEPNVDFCDPRAIVRYLDDEYERRQGGFGAGGGGYEFSHGGTGSNGRSEIIVVKIDTAKFERHCERLREPARKRQ